MVSGYAFEPIYYLMNVVSEVLQNIVNAINSIRKMFDYIRSQMAKIFEEIMGKVLNFIVPILKMIVVLKDMISKSQGIMTGGLYTGLGVYMTLKAALGAILQLIIIILIVLAALIVVFWIVPFTWGLAAAMTAVFIAISVPLLIIMIFFMRTLDIHTDLQIPGVPSCFDPDTIISLKKGLRRIKDIQIGDKLADGGIVTAIMKMSSKKQEMYKLNNILVSGTHMVSYKGEWIPIAKHPRSIAQRNYKSPFIYCFNTTEKTIEINNTVFSDWDELNRNEINEIRQKCKLYLPADFQVSDIHKYLDSGFSEDTLIKTYYGEKVPISEIEVNDTLQFGEKVIGVVKIDAQNIEALYKYKIGNNYFECTPNTEICDCDLGIVNLMNEEGIPVEKGKYLYNIITNKHTFIINNTTFMDYTAALEKYLDIDSVKLYYSAI